MTTFRALGDRVAVEIESVSGMGKLGSLFIPDATKSTRNQLFHVGTVRAAGPKAKQLTEHCRVLVSEYFGDEVEVDGRKLRVGRDRDVIGFVDSKDNVTPLSDRLLLEEMTPDRRKGDIFLPEDLRAKEFLCRVVAAGQDCSVDENEVVLVPKDRSVVVRFAGYQWRWIEEGALLVVL